MKKILFFVSILFNAQVSQSNGIYLWEYNYFGQQSCCLHIGNEDICNPNVACTRNMTQDLFGIYDYIGRILHMEKISTFPYAKFLNEAQIYIRKMAGNLSYRSDEYRVNLKFFHDMVLEQVPTKNDKNKSASGTTTTADAEKNKQKQEEVFEYLVKIGLASKFKK